MYKYSSLHVQFQKNIRDARKILTIFIYLLFAKKAYISYVNINTKS